MSPAKDRLTTAQWILERNLAWIAAADAKVAIIVTINVAMLGGLAGIPVAGWFVFDANQRPEMRPT